MKQFYKLQNKNVFDFLPRTFHIQSGTEGKDFLKFQKFFFVKQKELNCKNIWIIKPGENTNRGTGITVCDQISEIRSIISNKLLHANGTKKTFIIQQYIDKPLLFNKRKFDLRCYMLLTCINSVFKGYWYEEGYIRTSSVEFNIQNCTDVYIHLTNDAIQKHGQNYGKFESGNKLSFVDLQKYMSIQYSQSNINFFLDILPKLRNIALDSIKATYMKLNPSKKLGFEIFGLDFMIDEYFEPWLIEINTNPDITTNTPVCAKVIPPMIENALRIFIDPLYPSNSNWPQQKRQLAADQLFESNKFQLIFDEIQDGESIKNLYKDCKNINILQQIDENDNQNEQNINDY